jgi:hypothetical protein
LRRALSVRLHAASVQLPQFSFFSQILRTETLVVASISMPKIPG